ncbi:Ig-like domain-containing protein [Solibacillus sp. FSL W8-0372]|uniref:Ig-like domain-containing protein n=1 Tax=Solibacillus sp. FSL W8-0372 TaxID=2921713 RepID=UPI0030D21499
MVLYFYNKYNNIATNNYSVVWTYRDTAGASDGHPGYEIKDGLLYTTGAYETHDPYNRPIGKTLYQVYNHDRSKIHRYYFSGYTRTEYSTGAVATTVVNSRGSLAQSNIVAENGTYPTDRRHSDGFWYLRGAIVNRAPIWNVIPTQTVRRNTTATVNLNSYASDLDGNALSYTTSSSNTGVATVSVSGSTLTITGKSIGTVTITVSANDGSLSTNTTFSVTVANTGPVGTTIPNQTTKKSSTVTVNLVNYFSDIDNDALTFTASSANTNVATVSVSGNTLTITGVSIGTALISVTASDSKATASQSFTLTVTNSVPTVAVTAPSANMTLYENDLFNLSGQAADVDANQSVTVYAQINNEQRIVLGVGLSNVPVTFNKSLKFKGGQLYDGETPVTGNLTDGLAHTLKVWAQDGDGAQSVINERAFYVVPNRPPILTVDTVVPSGIINTDKFKISGTAGDPDGNPVVASYRINGGNSITLEVNEDRWEFEIALFQLALGENTIVIELMDNYNFKVSKTIKLNKNEVKTPILHSVARYKIEPPRGTAKGVLLYLQRDEDLTELKVELSMTLAGEQEKYVALTADNTAPVSEGIIEDEFYFEADEPKSHIILKLSTSRPNISVNKKIHLISGVLE